MNRARNAFLALAATGLVAALPMAASAAPTDGKQRHKAHAAGGDAPLPLPSIVRVRVDRGTASLARAADYVDRDMPDKAVASLLNARRNMYAAWRGAKYVIEHQPAAPPEAAPAQRRVKARSSGGAVVSPYADPATTAVAVLGFQHTVATSAYGLLDGAKGALRDSVSTTIFAALDRRDSAIAYIAAIPPPPADSASVHAHASGGAVAGDYATLMPAVVPDLDDEMQQIEGLVNGGALTSGEKRIMNEADLQVFHTEQTVNAFWPPVPAG